MTLILFQPACLGNAWGFQFGPYYFSMNKPPNWRKCGVFYGYGKEKKEEGQSN